MAEEKVRGVHSVAVRDDKGKLGSTQVELSYRRMIIRPPIAKQKRYPALMLTVLHAREPEGPVGRPHIDWKLITDLPVDGHDAAVEKLQWYAMRWKIEVFHKMLKSGCRAEQARLRTAERLVRLLAVFCILSWRVFWLTMLNRAKPDLESDLVLTVLETNILDRLIPDPTADPSPAKTLSLYLIKIARLVRDTRGGRLWNEFVARYHYLGYKTLVGAQMRFAVHDRNGWPLAMLGFSTAAWKLAPRDRFIGWTPELREKNLPLVVDNPRFLILPWIEIPNLGCNRSLKPWTGDSGFIVQIESRPHRGAGNMFCHALSSLAWRFSTRILAPI